MSARDLVATAEEIERQSYGAIVWSQLRKNRIAVFGLWCIGALFAVAIYAPLLSLGVPIALVGPGLVLPIADALFNRLLFENAVDIFFNVGLVASPFYVAAFLLLRRLGRGERWGRIGWIVGRLVALHFLLFVLVVPKGFGPVANPFYTTSALADTATLVAEAEARGESPWVVRPLRPFHYRSTDPLRSVRAPDREHWLGTDKEGRDVFARMVYGTRIALTVGVVAVSIFVTIGVLLGALAGYMGGRVDLWISRLIEVMICFPSFFLILTLAALVEERSIFHVMVIIGITSWTGVARLVRAEFLKQKSLDYVQAARCLGFRRRRIIFRHILPNAMAPVLVTATFGVASAILVEASLSFLGIGDVTAPSWGEILNTGRLEQKPWLILVPGFAIFFVVSVFNLVGEGLRDALDPKLRM